MPGSPEPVGFRHDLYLRRLTFTSLGPVVESPDRSGHDLTLC